MLADIVDAATRSRMMAGIRSKDTKPELVIRRGLHALGFRFLLHDRRLPGKPDMVLPRWRAVIFVQGCFWHGHDCPLFKWPQSRQDFWREKITGNIERDHQSTGRLEHEGWRVLTIWECALKGVTRIGAENAVRLAAEWLRSDNPKSEIRGQQNGAG